MITPKDIIEKKFGKAPLGGYKADDVDSFLEEIANDYNDVIKEKEELEKKIAVLADKVEEYRGSDAEMRQALVGAQRIGESVIREAKTKADEIIKEAVVKAKAVTAKSEQDLKAQTEGLEIIKKEVIAFKSKLLAIYTEHVNLINSIPAEESASAPAYVPAEEPAASFAPAAEETDEPQEEIRGFHLNIDLDDEEDPDKI